MSIRKLQTIVVLTRDKNGNQELKAELDARGTPSIDFPSISFSSANPQPIDLKPYTWLIFSSKRGIEYFPQSIPPHLKIAAVGPATHPSATLYSSPPTAKALSQDLLKVLRPEDKVLNVRGNLSLDQISPVLKEAGLNVDDYTVYETSLAERNEASFQQILDTQPEQLLFSFYSPSAVRNTIQLLGEHANLLSLARLHSVGPSTTQVLRELEYSENVTENPSVTFLFAKK